MIQQWKRRPGTLAALLVIPRNDEHNLVRRYNEKETRWLLERAGQLQRTTDPAAPHDPTLTDLESIALEAGLDPALLRQAARELDAGTASAGTRILGAPLRLRFERVLPFEIGPDDFGRILPLIETVGGGIGQTAQVGTTITWQSRRANVGRVLVVRLTPEDGATRISVEENFGDLAGGLFGGVLGGVGGGIGIGAGTAVAIALNSVALAFALPAFVIGTTFFSVRTGFKRYVRNRAALLEHLLQDVETHLQSTARKQVEKKASE